MNVTKCDCGAITIEIDGNSYSMSSKTFKERFPHLKSKRYKTTYFSCNHCVNHWGIDLCGCGCGREFGKCEDNIEGSDRPAQSIEDEITGCYSSQSLV